MRGFFRGFPITFCFQNGKNQNFNSYIIVNLVEKSGSPIAMVRGSPNTANHGLPGLSTAHGLQRSEKIK